MVNSFLLKVYQCSQAHNIYILFFNIFIQLLLSSHDLCVINKKDYYFVLSYSTILSFNPNEKEPQIIHYFLSCLFEVENIEQKTYHLTTFKTLIFYSTTCKMSKNSIFLLNYLMYVTTVNYHLHQLVSTKVFTILNQILMFQLIQFHL